jgi:hypothetical protein
VTAQRTKVDWAQQIKELIDVRYPHAERIVLVMDNLNTHTPASLYEAFPPAEAKRLADKLEIHDTPKHGSWLNIAEIELSVLARQCLDRRVPDVATLQAEVRASSLLRDRRVRPQPLIAPTACDGGRVQGHDGHRSIPADAPLHVRGGEAHMSRISGMLVILPARS